MSDLKNQLSLSDLTGLSVSDLNQAVNVRLNRALNANKVIGQIRIDYCYEDFIL